MHNSENAADSTPSPFRPCLGCVVLVYDYLQRKQYKSVSTAPSWRIAVRWPWWTIWVGKRMRLDPSHLPLSTTSCDGRKWWRIRLRRKRTRWRSLTRHGRIHFDPMRNMGRSLLIFSNSKDGFFTSGGTNRTELAVFLTSLSPGCCTESLPAMYTCICVKAMALLLCARHRSHCSISLVKQVCFTLRLSQYLSTAYLRHPPTSAASKKESIVPKTCSSDSACAFSKHNALQSDSTQFPSPLSCTRILALTSFLNLYPVSIKMYTPVDHYVHIGRFHAHN